MPKKPQQAKTTLLDLRLRPDNLLEAFDSLRQKVEALSRSAMSRSETDSLYRKPTIIHEPFADGDTEPAVNANFWHATFTEDYSTSTTITNFSQGREGQVITVLFQSGNATLEHGSGTNLIGQDDYTPPAGTLLAFRHIDGEWHEIGRPAAAEVDLRITTVSAPAGNPPTAAQLTSAFGAPASLGDGFIGILHATGGGGGNRRWFVGVSGSQWWYEELTAAT